MTSLSPTACADFLRAARFARRDVLRVGTVGWFGMELPRLLQAQAASAAEIGNATPVKRAKACILLFMWGGPAQQDTWDMKPLAPVEFRGEFQPIATSVPGVQICEHLPRLAQRADKLAIIRSMTHDDVNHTTATHYLLTGRGVPRQSDSLEEDWPTYGSVLARLGRGRGPLPPFVSMMPVVPNGAPRFVEQSHGQGAGWLGASLNSMRIDEDASQPDYHVGDFSLHADISAARANNRRALLSNLDQQLRRLEQSPAVTATRSHYDRAFSLLAAKGVTEAFDLSREPPNCVNATA